MKKTHEKTLPDTYCKAFTIDAKNKKTALAFSAASLVAFLLVLLASLALLTLTGKEWRADSINELMTGYIALIFVMVAYVVLHELVHGAVYKLTTGEKLTFGISVSCAYCGVKGIYVYRRTALAALCAPLLLFSALYIPVLSLLYFSSPFFFFIFSLLFGMHLGGCSADSYLAYLLLFKFKNRALLMRDDGDVQTLYLPSSFGGENE